MFFLKDVPCLFDSLESTDGAVNVSPPCDSEVTISPSQTRSSRRDFIMMPPEEKLRHFDRRARAHEDNQEVGVEQVTVASSPRFPCQCFCFSTESRHTLSLFTGLMQSHGSLQSCMHAPKAVTSDYLCICMVNKHAVFISG